MIVGNGLLATAFAPRFASDRALTVFASGVANSRETRQAEFERERDLLQHTLQAAPVMMYFSTLATYRRTAQSVNSTTTYFTRLIVVPWFVVIAAGVIAWFWKYLPTQAMLGAYVALQLVQGLYGLTMYQAMASLDRACAGTRQMRPDDQEFAKFLKVAR